MVFRGGYPKSHFLDRFRGGYPPLRRGGTPPKKGGVPPLRGGGQTPPPPPPLKMTFLGGFWTPPLWANAHQMGGSDPPKVTFGGVYPPLGGVQNPPRGVKFDPKNPKSAKFGGVSGSHIEILGGVQTTPPRVEKRQNWAFLRHFSHQNHDFCVFACF